MQGTTDPDTPGLCVAESKVGFLCVQVSVPLVIIEKGGDPVTPAGTPIQEGGDPGTPAGILPVQEGGDPRTLADLKSAKKGGDLSTPAAASNQMGSGRALHGALHALHKGQKPASFRGATSFTPSSHVFD